MEMVPASLKERKKLSEVDRRMLQIMLASNGKVSSLTISKQLEVPLTTVQRRRKRLESEFVEMTYVFRLEKVGWRKANLLISTDKGMTPVTGRTLLAHSSVTKVCRSIGEHTIDLLAEVVFKDNSELLNIIEWIKSTDGVREVIWTESVETLRKNSPVPVEMVELL